MSVLYLSCIYLHYTAEYGTHVMYAKPTFFHQSYPNLLKGLE